MTDSLRDLLGRFELEHAGPVSAQEARRWSEGLLDRLVACHILRSITPASSIRNEDCDHGCDMEPEVVTHATTGERFGIHWCVRGDCGLVRIPLDDLRRWEFDLLGIASTVARSINADSHIAEDIPDRLIEVGRISAGDEWRDVFLARGLAWDDAPAAFADARRLKVSAAPLVLALAQLPSKPIWIDCHPAIALLTDSISLDDKGLNIDLSGVLERQTRPHPDAVESKWLTVTAAAKRLLEEDVIDGLNLTRAKSRVSTAATRNHLVTNGKSGSDRRIESGSLARWILKLRAKNLAEDIEVVKPHRTRLPS